MEIKTIDEFKEFIMKKGVVMISKEGCPFCERAQPWLNELSEKHPEAHIATVKKDVIAKLLDVFQVQMYPTFVAVDSGKVADMFFGDTVQEKVVPFVENNI